MIKCTNDKCKSRCIGESERSLHDRISQHVFFLHTNKKEATGDHFNQPGHTHGDMRAIIIVQVKSQDYLYRKKQESNHIQRFNTFYNGINETP